MTGGDPVSTGVQLQNVGDADTTATVNLVQGTTRIKLADREIPQGSAFNYYFPTMTDEGGTDVPSGEYALVAEADQELQAIVVTEYTGNGAAGTYGSVAPATDVTLPIVFRNWASQNSQITVQNASSGTDVATVDIQIIGARGEGNGQKSGITLQPGASESYWVDSDTFGIQPNTPADNPTGFVGYARVTSTGAPVVVQSFIDIDGAASVAAFSGVDTANAAATTLYAPLIRSNFIGDTGLQLVNTNDTDANVTITYYTDPVALQFIEGLETSYTRTEVVVPANDSFTDFHGVGHPVLPDGTRTSARHNDDITAGGWFGVARIESDQSLIGVVQDVSFANNLDFATENQANYNVVTAGDAGSEFAVPLVRSVWLDNAATTGVQVQNTTDQEITVGIDYSVFKYNPDTLQFDIPATMTGERLTKTAAANGAANLYQGDASEIAKYEAGLGLDGATGWFGSAIVKVDTAGGKIVALVNDEGNGIDKANFNAIKLAD
jgi:urease beta subunit